MQAHLQHLTVVNSPSRSSRSATNGFADSDTPESKYISRGENMGWWKVDNTRNIIGDAPLDALGTAVADVVAEYQFAFNRQPSKEEWEALLMAVLGDEDSKMRPLNTGVVERVIVVAN